MVKINSTNSGADTLFVAFKQCITSKQIPIENIIGLASDGANVMLGKNNSFRTRLASDTKVLIIMKCICHSSALIASKASKFLTNVEDLLRALSSYFSHSSKRTAELAELQEYFGVKRHKILKLSSTRWLCMAECIKRVLENWTVLQHHFLTASVEDNLKQSDFIKQSLNCLEIKIYFLFLKFTLTYFNNFNELFQSNKILIHCLVKESRRLFDVIAQNCLKEVSYNINCKNPCNFLDLKDVYIGAEAENLLIELENDTARNVVKQKCLRFYTAALTEIQDRLPLTDVLFLEIEFIDPKIALSKNRPLHLRKLENLSSRFGSILDDVTAVMLEWRSMPLQFENQEVEKLMNLKIEDFWFEISNYKNFNDKYLFKNVAQLAKYVLSLPHSNAESERIFSIMNDVKTKKRNKMDKGLLSAISIIRSHGVNALNFKPGEAHYENMKNKNLYA